MKIQKLFVQLGLALVCGFLITGCNSSPSPGDGEKLLRQQVDSESQGQIKLVSFKKTDGQMSVVDAVKIYELDYEAEIEFQADGTWFKGMQGMGFGFSTQQAAQGSMAAFANQTVNGGITVHRGDLVKIAGVMQAEKKESGWVFEMGDSHVVSGPINPILQEIQKRAENGDARAESELGVKYYHGEGIDRNYDEAAKWFRKAADQGDPKGENGLGMALRFGEGVQKDVVEGTKFVRKAAEAGYAPAEINMGDIYRPEQGISAEIQEQFNGVKGDINETLKWYQMAAQQNYPYAQYKLGLTYETASYNSTYNTGLSRETNAIESVMWYQKVIENTDLVWRSESQIQLGDMYLSGIGVEKNLNTATNYYNEAAASGNKKAQKRLETWASEICINNLREIDAAKNMWALENGKTTGTFPSWTDLLPYLKDKKIPVCDAGGTYTINAVGQRPTCSLGTTVTPQHVLP